MKKFLREKYGEKSIDLVVYKAIKYGGVTVDCIRTKFNFSDSTVEKLHNFFLEYMKNYGKKGTFMCCGNTFCCSPEVKLEKLDEMVEGMKELLNEEDVYVKVHC